MFTYSRRAASGVRIESGRQVIHATLTSSMCHPPPFNISELQLDLGINTLLSPKPLCAGT